MMKTLRIATRQSQLALWQTQWVASKIQQANPNISIELVKITTAGDKNLSDSLSKIGGKGLFLKELEQALLNHEADIAVHSLKDVPAVDSPGLYLTAFLPRATPFDAFVSVNYNSFDDLPLGARVGTSSLRRSAQLLHHRPDLTIVPLRGNIDTRLNKCIAGDFDAIILAACGLERLNLTEQVKMILPPDICLPAVCQGIVAVQARVADERIAPILAPLNDRDSTFMAMAERSMNAKLGGSCQVPVAGHATWLADGQLQLNGLVAKPDGTVILRANAQDVPERADALGLTVAEMLSDQGAEDIIMRCTQG